MSKINKNFKNNSKNSFASQTDSQLSQCGTLFVVATPIGNLKDITFRAVEILQKVDLIYSEDTRVSKKLLLNFQIENNKLRSLHAKNEENKIKEIATQLSIGNNIALISDAGTPLISDPGCKLVKHLRQKYKDIRITPIPGASSLTAALSVAGIAIDTFYFIGFLPTKKTLATYFKDLKELETTFVIFETANRLCSRLAELTIVLGDKEIVVTKELTKIFETINFGSFNSILQYYQEHKDQLKGEFVILINNRENNIKCERKDSDYPSKEAKLKKVLVALQENKIPPKIQLNILKQSFNLRRNQIYPLITIINPKQDDNNR